MDTPSTNTTAHAMIRAIESNTNAFLLTLGRAAGSEERSEPSIHWIIGHAPVGYHNCVIAAQLHSNLVDVAIQASIERFRAYGVPGTWHVSPSMLPPNLGERLVAHGFTDEGPEPGMAVDLAALQDITPPAGLFIRRVTTTTALAAWAQTLGQGFGEGPHEAAWVGAMYDRIGLDVPSWRHYLGVLDGRPVATTSLFLDAGVAGIYFVFTLPEARRQGIGAALTRAALLDAHALGYRVGVLGASQMGYAVYQRLGFQEYCTFRIYEWRPNTLSNDHS